MCRKIHPRFVVTTVLNEKGNHARLHARRGINSKSERPDAFTGTKDYEKSVNLDQKHMFPNGQSLSVTELRECLEKG